MGDCVDFTSGPAPAGPPAIPPTMGGKIALAVALSRRHGLTLFGVALGGFIIIAAVTLALALAMGLSLSNGFTAAFAALAVMAAGFVVMMMFLAIGTNSLAFRYIDGDVPESPLRFAIFSPWGKFGNLVCCALAWLAVFLAAGVVSAILGLIPVLGWAADTAMGLFLSLTYFVATLYISDHPAPRAVESVTAPARLVLGALGRWVLAGLAILAAYVPAAVLGSMAAGGEGLIPTLAGLLALACGAAAFVFSTFLTGLTYRDAG